MTVILLHPLFWILAGGALSTALIDAVLPRGWRREERGSRGLRGALRRIVSRLPGMSRGRAS